MEKIEWHSPQYIHTIKTIDWYWIVGIITITIALVSIILNNSIFAILILMSSFTLSLYASRKPDILLNEINNTGIKKGLMFYPFDHIESFWVETGDRYPRLIVKLKQKLSQYLIVLIDTEDSEEIKAILLVHTKEEKMTESIFEKILIYLGF